MHRWHKMAPRPVTICALLYVPQILFKISPPAWATLALLIGTMTVIWYRVSRHTVQELIRPRI